MMKGDRIYVDAFSYWFHEPRVGDLVLYNPDTFRISKGADIYIINHYNALERIVALPGDHFRRTAAGFFRNGKPVPPGYGPLYPNGLPSAFEFDVPPGRYLVLISYGGEEIMAKLAGVDRAPNPNEGGSADWGATCFVTRDQIRGRCLFIWHPVKRRRWLTPPR